MTEIRAMAKDELKALGDQGFALALRLLRHREDAADAVQDALHQMFRKSGSFDAGKGSIKSWFLKIVRNRCIDMQRKSRPISASDSIDPVAAGSPVERMERNESIAMVREALAELPDAAREIILLRDFHGLGYSEIADVLGIAHGTVMSRLHRARQQLREQVKNRTE